MEIAVIVATALIKYGPEVAQGIANILHVQGDPALAQWNGIFAGVRTYAQLFPAAPVSPAPVNT